MNKYQRERERERESQTIRQGLYSVVSLMAPKKRSDKQQDPAKPELPARMTRSSAKRAANTGPAGSEPELLKKKKTKKAAKKEEENEEKNLQTAVIEQPEPELPKKKAKKVEKKEEEPEEVNSDTTAKTIVIEHW
jgi:hypothetical protein